LFYYWYYFAILCDQASTRPDLNSADIASTLASTDATVTSPLERVFLKKLNDAPFTVFLLHPYYNQPLSFELSLRNGGNFYHIPSPNTTPALVTSQLQKLGYCIQALPIKLSAQESNSAHAIDRVYKKWCCSVGIRISQKGEIRCSKEGISTVRDQIFVNEKGFTVVYNV